MDPEGGPRMSVIHQALQDAEKKHKDPIFIQIPKAVVKNNSVQSLISLLLVVCLGLVWWQLSSEKTERLGSSVDLQNRLESIETKYNSLMETIHTGDQFLDTRVQLDLANLKSDLKELSAKLDLADVSSLRKDVKDELYVMSKRLNTNEREHAVLNDRIEAIKKDLPASK